MPAESPVKLRQQRSDLLNKARTLVNKAEKEDRDLSAEENEEYKKIFADAEGLKTRYTRLENLSAIESELQETNGRITSNEAHIPTERASSREGITLTIHGQKVTFAAGTDSWQRCQPAYKQAFRGYLLGGPVTEPLAAVTRTNDVQGGYLTAPEEFVAELIKDIDNVFIIRKLSRKFSTLAKSLGAPRRTARLAAFQWGTEYTQPTVDTNLKFGKRVFEPHDMVGAVDVSNDFLKSALLDPEQLVREEIAYQSGELEEKAFFSGTGVDQPLGLFTPSVDGISTGRDTKTTSNTAITSDSLRTCKYSLKEFYRQDPGTRWIFNRTIIGDISKLKATGTGQYLWKEGIAEGEPDRLLGIAVAETEYAPNTYGAGLYIGGLFALRYYWIVDSLDMGIQRLVELQAMANQTRFLVRRKVDANVNKEEAHARLICNT